MANAPFRNLYELAPLKRHFSFPPWMPLLTESCFIASENSSPSWSHKLSSFDAWSKSKPPRVSGFRSPYLAESIESSRNSGNSSFARYCQLYKSNTSNNLIPKGEGQSLASAVIVAVVKKHFTSNFSRISLDIFWEIEMTSLSINIGYALGWRTENELIHNACRFFNVLVGWHWCEATPIAPYGEYEEIQGFPVSRYLAKDWTCYHQLRC